MFRCLGLRPGLVLLVLCTPGLLAATTPTEPTDNGGKPWRLALYQGGDYKDYHDSLRSLIKGLMTLGWIEPEEIPESQGKSTASLWRWLSRRARSKYLEFPSQALYDAGWDEQRRANIRRHLLASLSAPGNDVDMVIAMGTWAGVDLATDRHGVATTVVSASDPIDAGIVPDVHDSGRDHLHVQLDPQRYARQLRLFHAALGFKRLGVTYEDTLAGRSYAAMDAVNKVARERGFEVLGCHARGDIPDIAESERNVLDCFQKLAIRADAIYVTVHNGVTERSLPAMVATAIEHRVATFSQHGADEAQQGLLMSMSVHDFDPVGLFHAKVIARVLNGATPRSQPMVFEDAPTLAINLKTAHALGFIPSAEVLAGADVLFSAEVMP